MVINFVGVIFFFGSFLISVLGLFDFLRIETESKPYMIKTADEMMIDCRLISLEFYSEIMIFLPAVLIILDAWLKKYDGKREK